jgi:hypothetical protein
LVDPYCDRRGGSLELAFLEVVWAAQEDGQPTSKGKLVFHLAILVGLGSFLYPIRFIEHSYRNGILRGLLTAGAFLGTMLWLIYKAGKIFTDIDAIELKRQQAASDKAGN